MDTPFMFLIPNAAALKNQYEISQRFYFFQDEEQISLDEAYRFLSHRWREKQLNAKKKQPENTNGLETTSVGAVTKEKRLLVKKRNNKTRQQKNN
jgi:RNA polymerase-interacting CarD/CdnL/TRCF family regulator